MGQAKSVPKQPTLTRDLARLMDAEINVYITYNSILAEERETVRKLRRREDSTALEVLSAKRAQLLEMMRALHIRRMELVKDLPGAADAKFSEIISNNFHPIEVMELKPLIVKLKEQAELSRKGSFEFGQLVGFAQNVVNGILSIFNAASQNVVRCYGKSGKVKESFHPARSRTDRVIKEA